MIREARPDEARAIANLHLRTVLHAYAGIFPDDAFTVADKAQLTGRRINFRQGVDYPKVGGVVQPSCTDADFSICDAFAELNTLDGFDLQPRVLVPFTGPIDLASVNTSNFFISADNGTFVSGLRQLVFDPATNTLSGISDVFLGEATPYRIHVTSGILEFTVTGQKYRVEPGSTLHFQGDQPHTWHNPGKVEARAIWMALRPQ